MALLPTSPLWPPQRLAPNALPYGMSSKCFDYCPQTPPCQLRYFPPPCMCTTVGPPAAWTAPLAAQPTPAHVSPHV